MGSGDIGCLVTIGLIATSFAIGIIYGPASGLLFFGAIVLAIGLIGCLLNYLTNK